MNGHKITALLPRDVKNALADAKQVEDLGPEDSVGLLQAMVNSGRLYEIFVALRRFGLEHKALMDAAASADFDLRGALSWAGCEWGAPHSLLHSAEGAVTELYRRNNEH